MTELPAGPAAAGGRWFQAIADHAGAAYLRYSFTKGTEQEVAFLVDALGLRPGMRVLDVGCGPGRHCQALASRGLGVVGLDISSTFLTLARARVPAPAGFVRGDARRLPFASGYFDAVVSLCQGGFGLSAGDDGSGDDGSGGDDEGILGEIVRVLKPGAAAAVSAFSAYFQMRWLEPGDQFDAASGTHYERSSVRNPAGDIAEFDLWTTCFTPRELRLMIGAAGAVVEELWSVSPGLYGRRSPTIDHPEWLVLLRRPPVA